MPIVPDISRIHTVKALLIKPGKARPTLVDVQLYLMNGVVTYQTRQYISQLDVKISPLSISGTTATNPFIHHYEVLDSASRYPLTGRILVLAKEGDTYRNLEEEEMDEVHFVLTG